MYELYNGELSLFFELLIYVAPVVSPCCHRSASIAKLLASLFTKHRTDRKQERGGVFQIAVKKTIEAHIHVQRMVLNPELYVNNPNVQIGKCYLGLIGISRHHIRKKSIILVCT